MYQIVIRAENVNELRNKVFAMAEGMNAEAGHSELTPPLTHTLAADPTQAALPFTEAEKAAAVVADTAPPVKQKRQVGESAAAKEKRLAKKDEASEKARNEKAATKTKIEADRVATDPDLFNQMAPVTDASPATKEHASLALQNLNTKTNVHECLKILKSFKALKISDVDPSNYGSLIKACENVISTAIAK